uniref:Uncharacterized protein n=1 Tax=Picea sitchensis TaxID=3332 RepID=A9NL89_PICSI|nr:unknown [Picea sitchensis]ABK22628.1 unknown [Picea sitchensis]ACN40710.1 unknown [Picea sitchensis]
MASLISTVPLNNVFPAAAKATNAGKKKGLIEWLTDGFQKPDQFFETDPILQKDQQKDENGRPNPKKKGTGSQQQQQKKKSEGFGGLFAKK